MTGALFLAHRIPYPPNKGDKIRSHHWLRCLSRHYRVHLGTFVDRAEDLRHVATLDRWCASHHAPRLAPLPATLRSLAHLPTRRALSVAYYRERSMQRFVDRVLSREDIGVILVFSSTMAQYVAGDRSGGVRKVVDFVDVDSDKWRQYSERRGWPMSYVYRREGVRLGEAERRIAADFDASILISPAEVALLAQLDPDIAPKLHCVPNGVDTGYFDPRGDHQDPYPPGCAPIVFTGAMDYWPNVDAVTWYARQVLPAVRRSRPDVRFFVVGSHPARAVLDLRRLPGVEVTGPVPSVVPYLAHARLAVAPMRLARGMQNKVLEALAMDLPVLLTRAAQLGIGHPDEDSGMTVAPPEAMVEATLERLADHGPRRGREFVLRHFRWDPAFAALGRILTVPPPGAAVSGPEAQR